MIQHPNKKSSGITLPYEVPAIVEDDWREQEARFSLPVVRTHRWVEPGKVAIANISLLKRYPL